MAYSLDELSRDIHDVLARVHAQIAHIFEWADQKGIRWGQPVNVDVGSDPLVRSPGAAHADEARVATP